MTVNAASMSSAQTALAVLTRGSDLAPTRPTTPATPRAESPAVVIDARTARLAETARAAAAQTGEGMSAGARENAAAADPKMVQLVETAQAAAQSGEGAASSARAGFSDGVGAAAQAFFAMADGSDRWVEQFRQGLARSKEMVRLYEETGEIYSPDQHGNLQPDRDTTLATLAQKQEIIEGVRKSIPVSERVLPELEAMAKKHRVEAENYANVMRGR